jgi:hypothetical protein
MFRNTGRLIGLAFAFALALSLAFSTPMHALARPVTYKAAVITFRPELGSLNGNLANIRRLVRKALNAGAKVVVWPERQQRDLESRSLKPKNA